MSSAKLFTSLVVLLVASSFSNVHALSRPSDLDPGLSYIQGRVFKSLPARFGDATKTTTGVGNATVAIYEADPSTQTGKILGKLSNLSYYTFTTPVESSGDEGGFFELYSRKIGPGDNLVYMVIFCGDTFEGYLLPSAQDIIGLYVPMNCPTSNSSVVPPNELDLTSGEYGLLQCDNNPATSVGVASYTQSPSDINFMIKEESFDNRFRGGVDLDILGVTLLKKEGGWRYGDCILRYGADECASYDSSRTEKLSEDDTATANSFHFIPEHNFVKMYRPTVQRAGLEKFKADPLLIGGMIHNTVGSVPDADSFIPIREAKEDTDFTLPNCELFKRCNQTISDSDMYFGNSQECGGFAAGMADPILWETIYDSMETDLEEYVCMFNTQKIRLCKIQPSWEICGIDDSGCQGYCGKYILDKSFFRPELVLPKGSGRIKNKTYVRNDSFTGSGTLSEDFNIADNAMTADNLMEGNNVIIPDCPECNGKISMNKALRITSTDISGGSLISVFESPFTTEEERALAPGSIAIGHIGQPINLCSLSRINGENPSMLSVADEVAGETRYDADFTGATEDHADDKKAAVSYFVNARASLRDSLLSSGNFWSRLSDAVHTTCVEGTTVNIGECLDNWAGIISSVVGGGSTQGYFDRSGIDDTSQPLEHLNDNVKFPLSEDNFYENFPVPGPHYTPGEWGVDNPSYPWKSLEVWGLGECKTANDTGDGASATCRVDSCKIVSKGWKCDCVGGFFVDSSTCVHHDNDDGICVDSDRKECADNQRDVNAGSVTRPPKPADGESCNGSSHKFVENKATTCRMSLAGPYEASGSLEIDDSTVSMEPDTKGAVDSDILYSINRVGSAFTIGEQLATGSVGTIDRASTADPSSPAINDGADVPVPGGVPYSSLFTLAASPTSFDLTPEYNGVVNVGVNPIMPVPEEISLEDVMSFKQGKSACNLRACTPHDITLSTEVVEVINAAARAYDVPAGVLVATLFSESGASAEYRSIWPTASEIQVGVPWWSKLSTGSHILSGCRNNSYSATGPYQILQSVVNGYDTAMLDQLSSGRGQTLNRCNFLDSSFMAGSLLSGPVANSCGSWTTANIEKAIRTYKFGYEEGYDFYDLSAIVELAKSCM